MTFILTLVFALNIPPVSESIPNRQPQLAAAPDGTIAMVFGSDHAVLFSRSTDHGSSFSKPVKIDEVPALMLGRHRGPRVAFAAKTILVSAIAGGEQGNLLVWRSKDEGRTWSKPA